MHFFPEHSGTMHQNAPNNQPKSAKLQMDCRWPRATRPASVSAPMTFIESTVGGLQGQNVEALLDKEQEFAWYYQNYYQYLIVFEGDESWCSDMLRWSRINHCQSPYIASTAGGTSERVHCRCRQCLPTGSTCRSGILV